MHADVHPYFRNIANAVLGKTFTPSKAVARQTPNTLATTRRSDIPIQQAPAALYSSVSQYMAQIPVPVRQQIMLFLYDTNFYVELLTNRLINPILGTTGLTPVCEKDSVTEGVVNDFWQLNELHTLDKQEQTLRDFVILGEVVDLIAPHDGSFFMEPLLSQTIEQTVLDPKNYHEVIGVKQITGAFNDFSYHRIIGNERRYSLEAKTLRKSWSLDAFLWQNLKKTAPIPASSDMSYETLQKRGDPLMYTASDLFKALLDYLWTSIDRVQSLNTFNWLFKLVDPNDTMTTEQKRAAIKYWKKEIKDPQPNSAIFYTDELELTPAHFPAGVASGIEGLFKMLRNTAGWVGNSRDEDMGDSDSKFASMKQPGITNPTVETLQNLQAKYTHYRERQIKYVLRQKYEEGLIPNSEVDLVRGQPQFRVTFHAPEISKQDTAQATVALKTFAETWLLLRQQGQFTPESLAEGEQKVIKELMSIDLDINEDAIAQLTQVTANE